VFVTLDPERDKPEVLREYVAAFHPRFVALTGSVEEIRKVATLWKTWFGKVQPPGGRPYLIDHTAFTYLIDREGRYVAYFPPGTSGERMAELVREVLSGRLVATPR
jgi:protein SCO1/2